MTITVSGPSKKLMINPSSSTSDELVKCDDVVRLEHALTKRNLHSHDYKSPVSGRFEVSGFGNDGFGDSADNWRFVCENQEKGSTVTGTMLFALQHVDTRRFLYAEAGLDYNQRNCGQQCPIMGQIEISCDDRNGPFAKWKISSGLIFLRNDVDNDDEYDYDTDGDL